MTHANGKKAYTIWVLIFSTLVFCLFFSKPSLAARVVRSSAGEYTLLLSDSDPSDLIKGSRLDVRFPIIPGIFDARVLEKKGDYLRIKMIDGPQELPSGTYMFLKNLSQKKWFSREDLTSNSNLSSTFWGGGFANSAPSYGGIFGVTWLANKNIDLDVSGRVGTHLKENGNGVFLYGGGAGGRYFILDQLYFGAGGFYMAAEENNPKAPTKAAGNPNTGASPETSTPETRIMPKFHDEQLIFGEASIGFRMNTISNLKVGKGFTVTGELGTQFLLSVLSDNISDIHVIDADLITNSDTNIYGKIGFGYFF